MLLSIDWLGLQANVLAGVSQETIMIADTHGNITVIEETQLTIVQVDLVTEALAQGGPIALILLLEMRERALAIQALLDLRAQIDQLLSQV